MGSPLKEPRKPVAPHANGSITWKLCPGPAPRVSFHGTVDLAASKQSVFTSNGAEPERYGPYGCSPFKGLPMGLLSYFQATQVLRAVSFCPRRYLKNMHIPFPAVPVRREPGYGRSMAFQATPVPLLSAKGPYRLKRLLTFTSRIHGVEFRR